MKHPILIVTGPTGSGKTQFAIHRARQIGACLLPMDQLQLYSHLEVGVGFNRELLAGLRFYGYQSLSPWEVFRPERYVAWLSHHLERLSPEMPVVVEGGCTSYLRRVVASRNLFPVLERAEIVALEPIADERQRMSANWERYTPDLVERIVKETAKLCDLGYWSPSGMEFFRECESLFIHPERTDSRLAWALRISARIYFPAAQVVLGQLSLADARDRIVRNVEDICTYQLNRIADLKCKLAPDPQPLSHAQHRTCPRLDSDVKTAARIAFSGTPNASK